MKNSIDIDRIDKYLGYYYGLSEVLSLCTAPQPGMYFLNGETNSIWMWDVLNKVWIDTNRVDSGLKGMLTEKTGNSPRDFEPNPQKGIKVSYFYVAESEDCDENPDAVPKTVTFTYFKNGNLPISVSVRKTSIITLYWNGDYWEVALVPMGISLSLYAKTIDLQAEKQRAEGKEIEIENSIKSLNPKLLKGTLYLSNDETKIYTDNAKKEEYKLHGVENVGLWFIRGNTKIGLFVQAVEEALIYSHSGSFVLPYKWDGVSDSWVRDGDNINYTITLAEKAKWNKAITDIANEQQRATSRENDLQKAINDEQQRAEGAEQILENSTQRFVYTNNVLLNGIIKELYVDFDINTLPETLEPGKNYKLAAFVIDRGRNLNIETSPIYSWGITVQYNCPSNPTIFASLSFNKVYGELSDEAINDFEIQGLNKATLSYTKEGVKKEIGEVYAVIDWDKIERNKDTNNQIIIRPGDKELFNSICRNYKHSPLIQSYFGNSIDWTAETRYNLNDFKAAGRYVVRDGVRGMTSAKDSYQDNLPFDNYLAGESVPNFAFVLDVTKSTTMINGYENTIVGQKIVLSNRIGGETKTYTRSYTFNTYDNVGAWSNWSQELNAVNLGAFKSASIESISKLDELTDIGTYVGGYVYFSAGTSHHGTFKLEVFNDYLLSAQNRYMAPTVTQVVTLSESNNMIDANNNELRFDNVVSIKKRYNHGNGWSNWAEIGGETEGEKCPNTEGCVFMSLGDSITTETYSFNKKLREHLKPSKYYNLAVSGARWADYPGTDRYNGNPIFESEGSNYQNIIGNQLQKIINNPATYNVAPDIIIIAAGTNDTQLSPITSLSSNQEMIKEIDSHYIDDEGNAIPVTEPTFSGEDTYMSHRKTIPGAMRYVVCKLQQMYPNAKIYILTPIQACNGTRNYKDNIEVKQRYITECAKHLAIPVIHVGEECGIQSDFEYLGAMWGGRTNNSYEKSGRDLLDGIHPNESGGAKMADYVAKRIINDNVL